MGWDFQGINGIQKLLFKEIETSQQDWIKMSVLMHASLIIEFKWVYLIHLSHLEQRIAWMFCRSAAFDFATNCIKIEFYVQ